MINKSKKILSLLLVAGAVAFIGGNAGELHAQSRDPFTKPGWAAPKTANPSPSNPSGGKPVKIKPVAPAVMPVGIPPIQDRINYYKQLRETAAVNNQPIPKPTVVMTVNELTVTGIFRTPRGYAATVQAVPINLYYTIYPGEKIFDGQLVAIEENRLVFRKVTKLSNGKFIASEENKAMRQYTEQEVVQGTAPVETPGKTESANNSAPAQTPTQTADPNAKPTAPAVIISPVDEMNRQLVETPKSAKEKSKGKSNSRAIKKPVKVANNKNQ